MIGEPEARDDGSHGDLGISPCAPESSPPIGAENGIEKFEEAFLAHIVIAIGEDNGAGIVIFVVNQWHVRFRCPMPDDAMAGGMTVGQRALPELAEIYKTGHVPPVGLLGAGGQP